LVTPNAGSLPHNEMNPLASSLTGIVALMVLSGWTIVLAVQRAVDGFEDELGFHFGELPRLLKRSFR